MIDQKILDLCMKVNGVIPCYPFRNEVGTKPLDPSPEDVGKYGWNNGKVSFVTPEGDYYVTPYCVEVADYLITHGYENGYIYVPFSNGDEPSDGIQAQKWRKLCIEAMALHNQKEKERRKENIKSIATSKGIKKLPDEAYEMSLEIPSDGLNVRHFLHDSSVTQPVSDYKLKEAVGTYCQNNGRIVFVDDKGKTYVTPYCHEIRSLLYRAGYTEGSLFVPLSNGEDIVDKDLNDRWQKLCMGARKAADIRTAEERKERVAAIARKKGIEELPDEAYRLTFEIPQDGIETTWFSEHSVTNPVGEWDLENAIGTYCQNNGKVVFVDNKGRTFVTPFAAEIRALLGRSGYREGSMFVPFSNGEIPTNEIAALKWKQLCNLARQVFEKREEERKAAKLVELAKAKHIKELPDIVYQLSMKIPKDGFRTLFFEREEDVTRPVYDWELGNALGTYCQNNGKVVFVDNKGDTYVTPHSAEVSQMLDEAGYVPGSLFVPLSNGERILDPELDAQWQKLCARLPEVGSGPKM